MSAPRRGHGWIAAVLVLLLLVCGFWIASDRGADETGVTASAIPAATDGIGPRSDRRSPPDDVPAEPERVAEIDRDLDLHGEVVSSTGEPVPGALVACVTSSEAGVRLAGWFEGPRDRAGPTTTTDVAGAFRVRLERGACTDVVVTAPGFARTRVARLQAGERVQIVLEPASGVLVSVTAAGGAPVSDAVVQLRTGNAARREPVIKRLARTGFDGRCTFDDVAGGASVRVEVRHPAFAEARSEHSVADGMQTEIGVVLEEGVVLRGRVIDARDERPVAGARVSAGPDRVAVTRADGAFEIKALDPARSRLIEVSSRGFSMQRIALVAMQPLRYRAFEGPTGKALRRVDEATELEVRLEPGFELVGRIVDAAGDPLPDATVTVSGFGYFGFSYRAEATTDAAGRFAFADLSRGIPVYVLLVSGAGGARRTYHVRSPGDDALDLGDIEPGDGFEIAGVVRDEHGRPAARCEVVLRGTNADVLRFGAGRVIGPAGDEEWLRTDDLGRFRFVGVPAGEYVVEAHRTGALAKLAVAVDAVNVDGLELTLNGLRTFEVVVRDEQGNPVEGVGVATLDADGHYVSGQTDAAGVATMATGDTPLKVIVHSRADGPQVVMAAFPWPPEDARREVVVVRADWIEGRVFRPDGSGWPRVVVQAVRCSDGRAAGRRPSGAGGRFAVPVPVGEPVDLVLTSPGVGIAGIARGVEAGAKGVEIRATRVATDRSLVVDLRDPDGAPLAGLAVLATARAPVTSAAGRSDASGRVELSDLPDVELQLFVSGVDAGGRSWATVGVPRVVPGDSIRLDLVPSPEVRGRVWMPDGGPTTNVVVSVIGAGRRIGYAVVGEDGRFLCPLGVSGVDGLRVRARSSGFLSGEVAYDGGDVELTLSKR